LHAPYRDPVILAKQVATIDHFSKGSRLACAGTRLRTLYRASLRRITVA
jgi:hypothetical protein